MYFIRTIVTFSMRFQGLWRPETMVGTNSEFVGFKQQTKDVNLCEFSLVFLVSYGAYAHALIYLLYHIFLSCKLPTNSGVI